MDIFLELDWDGGSGPGSDPDKAQPYLKFVSEYIRIHNVRSVLDLGCGDGRLAEATDWRGASYVGLDIKTGHDILTCKRPEADLVLVKDVLQHWSNAAIDQIFPRLYGCKHVLITNCCDPFKTNEDITTGYARALDLAAEPFNWPVREVLRWRGDETKAVVTWIN